MYRPRTCLLKPSHFSGHSTTRLTKEGLEFDLMVGWPYRQDYIDVLDFSMPKRKAKRITSRGPTRCIANPRQLDAASLRRLMREQQPLREGINIGYDMPEIYDRTWKLEHFEDGVAYEGQAVVVVAFEEDRPAGYSTFRISLGRDRGRTSLILFVNLQMTYVVAARRGLGLGIDLTLACSSLITDVACAAYSAAPKDWAIDAIVTADYESEGGRRFAESISSDLEIQFQTMPHDPAYRPDVQIGAVTLDAGY